MSEFAYSWLANYRIDRKTKMTEPILDLSVKKEADFFRLQLLVGINAQRLSHVWEYETLTEFMDESLSRDDMVFYLHMRNTLWHGP